MYGIDLNNLINIYFFHNYICKAFEISIDNMYFYNKLLKFYLFNKMNQGQSIHLDIIFSVIYEFCLKIVFMYIFVSIFHRYINYLKGNGLER